MATLDVTSAWIHGSSQAKLTAKRGGDSYQEFSEEHVEIVLGGGSSTDPASGSAGPWTHVVVWSHGGIEFTSTCRSFVSQADADAEAQALKDAVVDAGGTVISG